METLINVPKLETKPVAGVQGGTQDYEKLKNLPEINGVQVKGELTTEDLKIEIPDVSKFITSDVDDLKNYYDSTTVDKKLDKKQSIGDYALKSEIPIIEGLTSEEITSIVASVYDPMTPKPDEPDPDIPPIIDPDIPGREPES